MGKQKTKSQTNAGRGNSGSAAAVAAKDAEREAVLEAFRRWGYLEADLDPLGHLKPQPHPELEIEGPHAEEARRYYCGTIAVEAAHIPEPERRQWIAERVEAEPDEEPERERILERLMRAEVFERVLQSRYLGTKRFSLEGHAALLPLLDELLNGATRGGAEQAVIAMSHRGRLNVMVHIVGREPGEIFAGFEDVDPRSVLGSGDVKYHRGATGEYRTREGGKLNIHLVSNPSHLESVDPVALGRARAKQTRLDGDTRKVLPILLHGDAAFAGQGIAAETLNLCGVRGYSVGGAVHVIVNNLIGFTTNPEELHSSRFAADLAKRLPIPVFHVNAEDPEAVVRVARWAVEYRYEFGSHVVIDLVGYRRHGHSEVDDPTITQPVRYKKIEDRPPTWKLYAEQAELESDEVERKIVAEYEAEQKRASEMTGKPSLRDFPDYWDDYFGGRHKPEHEVDTGLPAEEIGEITEALTRVPEDFHVHPKVKRLLEERRRMGAGEKPVDYGMAEALAFGSLVRAGVPVRVSGQDTRRGTFNTRHAVLMDTETEEEYVPLEHVAKKQARFEIYNSILSEAAVLGYEYGFSRDYPEALVCWEAQFGDFVNGAQIPIDQFIAAGEDKWGLLSGVVLLLPHGYEGQGPEHSSARIERFLQLAAEDNIQIAQPSTAAQYFHLLRRQALRRWRKPLVVFTPKSMLRHPDAASKLEEFARLRFHNVIDDDTVEQPGRILLATGKILHELRRERARRKDTETAIIAVEQLYPFPEDELHAILDRWEDARDIVWVQEEPANMGARAYMMVRLARLAGDRHIRSVKRSASASPATGSAEAHAMEQKTLLTMAFARH